MKRSQKDTEDSARKISRRALVIGSVQLGILAALGLRMRYLQVDQADEFRMLAEENRINMRLLAPARGLIHDRNGVLIAGNAQNYRITIVREDAGDVEEALDKLVKLVNLDQETIDRTIKEVKRRSAFVPVTVADRLSWADVAEVAVNAPALPGITPEVGLSRSYPLMEDFAHIVGYVGPVSEYYLNNSDDDDPLLQIPEFQIGKSGAEARLEKRLRGKAGYKRIEVNAVGRVMRELDRQEGQPGENIQLGIDANLQNYVQQRLEGESAAVVVVDCDSGDLVAIGSNPSFDPNKFVRGISSADYKSLTENMYRPLANKSVQGAYPPGSTYKMVTALAALEGGFIRPDETIYCPGFRETGGRRFHCWKRQGHGRVDMNMSLQQSCDVYYYALAERVGIDKMTEMANRLGLGIRHDIPMSAVSAGLTPTKQWKQEARGAEWQIGDSVNAVIGQGYVLASPLQLALMTARIATGRAILPRLIRSVNGIEEPSGAGEDMGISAKALATVRKGMYSVSNSGRGTGYRSRIVEETMQMAGKSGTSQVRNITAAERARGVISNEDLPWERRDHALFVGYAPFDNPRYAVSVVVEHGGGGSTAAAPVVRDVLLQALYGKLPPLEAYPSEQREKIAQSQRKLRLRLSIPESETKIRA